MRLRESLDIWYPWIIAALLGLLLAVRACEPQLAQAGEWSLDLKGGLTFPMRTTPDGTYYQDPYPHQTKLLTGAVGAGLSYQITPAWSVQAHYLNLGSSRIKGRANSDENYDFRHHRCTNNCTWTYGFRATDSLEGGDLTATYRWHRDGLSPFVKGGLALLYHRAKFRNEWGDEDRFNGWIPSLEVGAGLQYKLVYVELDYFQGMNFGGQNLPISTQQIVTFAGIRYGWGS